ncbi:mucin-21-like [Haliotis cracherodii]|uniref:mucin-21-like n=1 Tax=Haliotis cracherodii TaxID=6455 RepID=UPI0039E9106F
MQLLEVLCTITLLLSLLEQSASVQSRKCPKLSLPNGRVKMRVRGKFAYFKCKKRYTRLGDRFAVCLQSETWSHPTPICISRGCPPLGALPQMEVEKSYNGALLKFTCPVGTERTGPEVITCDGREWSEDPPTCNSINTMECDFEKGICGWGQDTFDNFEWTRMSGATPKRGTGPPGDHTTGSGFYLFMKSSSLRKAGDTARLISPEYPPTLRNMCFEFWYHMKGPSDDDAVGSLEIYILPYTASIEESEPKFYHHRNQGNEWHRGLVKIPDHDHKFKIVIVGTRKGAYASDIAIDDLRMFNCSEVTTTTMQTTTTTTTTTTTRATRVTVKTGITDSVMTADRVRSTTSANRVRSITSPATTREMAKNVTIEIVPPDETTLPVHTTTTAKSVTTSSVGPITTTVVTTLQTTPTMTSTSTTSTTSTTTKMTTPQRQTSTVRFSAKLSINTKAPTATMTSTPAISTTSAPTSTQRPTLTSTSSAVTSVYSFTSETKTNATNGTVTTHEATTTTMKTTTTKRATSMTVKTGITDSVMTAGRVNSTTTSPASTREMAKNVTMEIVPSGKTTLPISTTTTAKPATTPSVAPITTTVLTTLQTTPTTTSTSATSTTSTTTKMTKQQRQTSTVGSSEKLSTNTKAPTATMMSTLVTSTNTAPTSTQQRKPTSTSSAVTSVFNFSSMAQTNVTNGKITAHKGESHVTHRLHSMSPRPDGNIKSSGDDDQFTGTIKNDITTPSTSGKGKTSTTPPVIPAVADVRNTYKASGGRVMSLIIWISAGIIMGMIVTDILAWLWTRNQRRNKDPENAEDELNMHTASDAAIKNT